MPLPLLRDIYLGLNLFASCPFVPVLAFEEQAPTATNRLSMRVGHPPSSPVNVRLISPRRSE